MKTPEEIAASCDGFCTHVLAHKPQGRSCWICQKAQIAAAISEERKQLAIVTGQRDAARDERNHFLKRMEALIADLKERLAIHDGTPDFCAGLDCWCKKSRGLI